MRWTSRLVIVLASTHALACGQYGAGLTAEELCERLTRSMCEGNVRCCDLESRTNGSVEECVESNLDLCDLIIGENARSPSLLYDAIEADRLAAAIGASAASCAALPDLGIAHYLNGDRDAPQVGLALVFEPTLPNGATCGVVGAPGNACMNTCVRDGELPLGSGGTCMTVNPLAEGDPCESGLAGLSYASCAEGLACAPCTLFPPECDPEPTALVPGLCAPRHALGDACGFGTCADGLYCDRFPGFPDPGTCALTKPDGEPCVGHQECDVGHCEGADEPGGEEARCGVAPPERSHCPVWRGRIG